MVEVAYTCLKMTNKLIANLPAEKGSQPKPKVIPNGFTGQKKKSPSEACNPFDWVITEVLCLPVPFPFLFMFSPNSIQQQKRKKRTSYLFQSLESRGQGKSSPTTFFFFTSILKRRHMAEVGRDLWRLCGPISLLKAQSPRAGSAAFQASARTETSQAVSATCACVWHPHS